MHFKIYSSQVGSAPWKKHELLPPISIFRTFNHLWASLTTLAIKQALGIWKMREEEIEKLRGVVRDCVSKHLYSSAIFFADKVAAFTNDPADIYMQAQALFLGRHYRRAFHLLNASKIVLRDLRFRYLAAKCLVSLSELRVLQTIGWHTINCDN